MAFTPSVPLDITLTIPGSVKPASLSGSETATNTGVRFDMAIGGLPFMMNPSEQRPYVRQTAPIQKPQFDVSQSAGEQTLDQYWIRSQTSWHRGAGVGFYEPGTAARIGSMWDPGSDLVSEYRFTSSEGVDVWKRDQVTLLKAMVTAGTTAATCYATTGKLADDTDVVFLNEGGTIKRRTAAGVSTTYTGGTAATTKVAVAGLKVLAGHATGIDVGDTNGSTKVALWTIATGAAVVPYWVKGRIVASRGNILYQLTLAGGAITATEILVTHPDSSWIWTDVTDGPKAVYASGYSGSGSAIYAFTLIDAATGSLPILGQAYEVASFPTGERVTAIRSYLGTYLGIGTSRGVRIALIDPSGAVNYGPLVIESDYPVLSLEGHGNYIYAGVQSGASTGSCAYRIDLGQPLPHEDLRFAYATDALAHVAGAVNSVAFLGSTDRVVLAVAGTGFFAQSATVYEARGNVLSGRVRFNTTEDKVFRLADLNCAVPAGTVDLSILDEGLSETNLITLSSASTEGDSIGLMAVAGYHEWLQFRISLTRSADTLSSPVLKSLQIKALPAPKRQRLVQFPLNCVDKETDALGTPFGRKGYAWERIQALEAAEVAQVVLQVQDFTNGETFSGTVEQIEFTRILSRSRDGSGNFGGTLKLTVKRL